MGWLPRVQHAIEVFFLREIETRIHVIRDSAGDAPLRVAEDQRLASHLVTGASVLSCVGWSAFCVRSRLFFVAFHGDSMKLRRSLAATGARRPSVVCEGATT